MEPQTDHFAQILVTGLLFVSVLGIFFFLRRIHLRIRRISWQRVERLLGNREQAIKRIGQIDERQWHRRLNSSLRIGRRDFVLTGEQLSRLAAIDKYQERIISH